MERPMTSKRSVIDAYEDLIPMRRDRFLMLDLARERKVRQTKAAVVRLGVLS
jgi:hypothetical protein